MIDFNRVLGYAFLRRLYRGVLRAILESLAAMLTHLSQWLDKWHRRIAHHLSITPQVWSLERLLNDEFDAVHRRIVIEEPQRKRGNFIFRASDPQDKKFYLNGKVYLGKESKAGGYSGFVVVLPLQIKATDRMYALIDRYKLAGMNYTIINR